MPDWLGPRLHLHFVRLFSWDFYLLKGYWIPRTPKQSVSLHCPKRTQIDLNPFPHSSTIRTSFWAPWKLLIALVPRKTLQNELAASDALSFFDIFLFLEIKLTDHWLKFMGYFRDCRVVDSIRFCIFAPRFFRAHYVSSNRKTAFSFVFVKDLKNVKSFG